MARLYFDIHDGVLIRDRVGRECFDEDDARRQAVQTASRLVGEELTDSVGLTLMLTVRREDGTTALTIRMACQVEAA